MIKGSVDGGLRAFVARHSNGIRLHSMQVIVGGCHCMKEVTVSSSLGEFICRA